MTPPHFLIFVIISPLKRAWPFIWTNLTSHYPSIICIKYDWIRPAGSGEERKKTRGPGATSLTWVILSNISINSSHTVITNNMKNIEPVVTCCTKESQIIIEKKNRLLYLISGGVYCVYDMVCMWWKSNK